MSDLSNPSSDYASWLGEVKSRIQSARISAARAVNRELILLYWDIGQGIVEKQSEHGWGATVIDQLSDDLRTAFPEAKGFSSRNLRDMKRLFTSYADPVIWRQLVAKLEQAGEPWAIWQQPVAELEDCEILEGLQQLVSEVPWGHNLFILIKLSDPSSRFYYLHATIQCGWTRPGLLSPIKAGAYDRLPYTSRVLAENLDSRVCDATHSPLTKQAISHMREEVISCQLQQRVANAAS